MIKNIFSVLVISLSLGATMMAFTQPTQVSALFENSTAEACKGVNLSNDSSIDEKCTQTAETKLNQTIAKVINILSVIIGIAAVIVLIVSGLRFITSGGDANGVASARNSIIYALVGLAVVAIAQALVKFVLSKTQ